MEPFELDPREWAAVQALLNQMIRDRGLAGTAEDFATVLRLDWHLLTDKSNRDRMILHLKHSEIEHQAVATETQATNLRTQQGRLPPDPGRVPDPSTSP
jgi:hypothetical protein